MTAQIELAKAFHRLHVKGDPVVLFNVWDAGSARAVANAGATAIATGSWSVAAAHGREDGQALSLALALENLARIVASVSLPVTIDIEAGYGQTSLVKLSCVRLRVAPSALIWKIRSSVGRASTRSAISRVA